MTDKKSAVQQGYRDKLESFIRWRWFMVGPLLISVIVSIFVSIMLSPQYETSSLIQISDKQIVDPLVEGLAVSPKPKEQIEALLKYVQSWPRLQKLVENLNLDTGSSDKERERYILSLRKRIKIEMKGSDLVQVSYFDPDPVAAQKVVNTITRDFIEENMRIKKEEARKAIEFIGEQLNIYRKKLEDSEKKFATHKIDADLRTSLNRKKLLSDQLSSLQKIIPSQVKMEHSPVFSRLQSHLAELEIERARLKMDSKAEHPRLVELNREIEELRRNIDAELKKDMVRESVSMVNPSYFESEQELKKLEMDLDYLAKRKKELEESGIRFDRQLSEEELATLQTGKKVDEDIYQVLLKQMEAAYVSERLQDSDKAARLTVIEYARLPISPMKPIRGKVMFVGIFMGLLAGMGLVFTMEYLDRSFRTVEDAKSVLNLPVLGSISRLIACAGGAKTMRRRWGEMLRRYLQKHKMLSELRFISPHIAKKSFHSPVSEHAILYHEPKCAIAEEFRIVRTNIQHYSEQAALRKLMVTSSVHSEGKSTTSMNLAIALADSGKNTLLIDADLRRGMLHEHLSVPQSPGLSTLLHGSMLMEAAFARTEIRNLTLIPCGTRPVRPAELLGSRAMEQLLSKGAASFDVVIIDAPPVLNLPDASILSRLCDGVVLIVQAERTQREEALRAHGMLAQARANIIGFVLTNVQYYIPKYLYDYYYGR